MIWFILALIIATVIAIVYMWDWGFDSDGVLVSIIIYLTSLLVATLIWLSVSLTACCTATITYTLSNDTQIVALKDNMNVSGHRYMFSGYVDEKLYYFYATETDLGYTTDKVPADNSFIKYTEDEPHIETYEVGFKNELVSVIASPIGLSDRHIIYCPDDTLTNEFEVDLE